jgi:hypothetical protein
MRCLCIPQYKEFFVHFCLWVDCEHGLIYSFLTNEFCCVHSNLLVMNILLIMQIFGDNFTPINASCSSSSSSSKLPRIIRACCIVIANPEHKSAGRLILIYFCSVFVDIKKDSYGFASFIRTCKEHLNVTSLLCMKSIITQALCDYIYIYISGFSSWCVHYVNSCFIFSRL